MQIVKQNNTKVAAAYILGYTVAAVLLAWAFVWGCSQFGQDARQQRVRLHNAYIIEQTQKCKEAGMKILLDENSNPLCLPKRSR